MILKELYIENFGKLSKFKLSLSDGMNSFTAENGYGKTTLSVFIKAMLYGFDDTRKQSLDENERKKYTPWQRGAFGGYLTFRVGDVTYRAERLFGQKSSEDVFKLYDLNTGKESSAFSSALGNELFGIDSDGFERTVFLSEKNLSGKNTNPTISAKLSDLVGTEGDIGGFDDAIKLLDDRRRFYQKRGGAGEIQEIESEVSELEEKLRSLHEMQRNARRIEAHLSYLNEQAASLRSKKDSISKRAREEQHEREKQGYKTQYLEMLDALKADEMREGELLKFFEKKLPTSTEIAFASESVSDIYRLRHKLSEFEDNKELNELKSFFSEPTSSEECESMKAVAKRISEHRTKAFSSASPTHARAPFKRIPTHDEIEAHSRMMREAKKKSKPKGIAFSVLGTLVTAGCILGGRFISNTIYPLALGGFLLILVGIFTIFLQKNTFSRSEVLNNTLDFILEVYGDNKSFHSAEEALSAMENDLSCYSENSEHGTSNLTINAPSVDLATQERRVREFCEKFPKADGITLEEKTEIIAHKCHRYEMLLEFEADKEKQRQECKEELHKLCKKLYEFISLFPTSSDDPVDEIRRNLAEHDVLRTSLDRRREALDRFAASHGIDTTKKITNTSTYNCADDSANTLYKIEEELLELEREKTRIESERRHIARELEGIDELEEIIAEKRNKIRRFRENLSVITKTKDFLAMARDSMTAKYIESTKSGFEKYVSLLDEEYSEFTVDTSFTYTKTELGASRQAEAYSRGIRDMHALAMRLAIIDSLYSNEAPPIILDDPFMAFDDVHLERATRLLKKLSHNRQVLYFTCSSARKLTL